MNGTSGNDDLHGTEAADRLNGHGGDDTLSGAAGNDTLDGGTGSDRMFGGEGNDIYILDSEGDSISDTAGEDTVIATQAYYVLGAGLENLTLRGSWFEVQGDGNSLGNVIRNEREDGGAWIDGADGNDTLLGGGGWDVFSFSQGLGAYGDDVVDGGGGSDGLRVGTHSAVVVDFRAGTVTGGGAAGGGSVTFANIEHAAGGSFHDRLIADDSGITLYGGDGNDTLVGGAGDDHLDSDADGTDAPRNPFVAGHDRVTAGGGNDYVSTGGGNDVLHGGAGADRLRGGEGNDTLCWDAQDVYLDGDGGTDQLRLKSGNLNLTSVDDGQVRDVEIINVTNGGRNKLTLNARDILDISSSTNTLTVLGDGGDSVNIVGSFVDRGVSGGYHRYTVGSATLLVDTDITSVY